MSSLWVIAPPKKSFIVGVSDMISCNDAGADLVTHSLGSCIGVTAYDPVRKVGGLLHLMLPDSSIDATKAAMHPFMFADTGLPRLFHAVYALGGEKGRLEVKVAGGAQFLDEKRIFNIGERNSTAVLSILARNGVKPSAGDVGGQASRTVRLDLSSGKVSVQQPGKPVYLL